MKCVFCTDKQKVKDDEHASLHLNMEIRLYPLASYEENFFLV